MSIFYKTLLILIAANLGAQPIAAQQNTYRPGNAYLKTVASDYRQCAWQCQGDAACRGWNFIRPHTQTASGICEFNAQASLPISSPVSISGEIRTEIDALMSRAVHKGANTVRVGTPIVRAENTLQPKTVRQPVPVRTQVQPTAIQTIIPVPVKISETTRPQKKQMTAEQIYYRQQYLARKQALEQQPRRPVSAPRPPAPVIRAVTQALAIPRPNPPLYGSLHDDLSATLPRIARPQTAPDNLANPNAPIATSRALPSQPIKTSPLPDVNDSVLAGG